MNMLHFLAFVETLLSSTTVKLSTPTIREYMV